MTNNDRITVLRAKSEADRQRALEVLSATYRDEKGWVLDERRMFTPDDLLRPDVSWFVVCVSDRPVGVLRVLYAPPLDQYREYGLRPVEGNLDIEKLLKESRIAEIGRFAVLPEHRKNINVVTALMRSAATETLQRDFTHYITDIFEGEKHSPYAFHTRILGFKPVATHDVGELKCPNRRITMLLDLKAGYRRLRKRQGWIYRFLTENWDAELHAKLLRDDAPQPA
jgi:hypothetical protein